MTEKLTLKDVMRAERDAAATGMDSSVAAVTPGQDLSYAAPAACIPLPSGGKIYPPDSALFDTVSLDIRAMTVKDENILTSPALIRKGKMLSALMRACVTNRSINPDEMLTGDRNALMIGIRNTSYGPGYNASVVCPKCNEEDNYEFDLSRLSVKSLEVEPVGGIGQNVFGFTLPITKKKVHFRLMTADASTELEQILEGQRRAKGPGAVEENVTQSLAFQIISIDGETDRKAIHRFVEGMPVRDSRSLRAYIDKISPGVDMDQHMECTSCGVKSEVEVPITAEFFWPKERE